MKTLTNHTIVYDGECPMCDFYTNSFIKTGMLACNGRVAYGNAKVPAGFNNTKARNEIALIDYDNGTVTYGLESLIKIISTSFPLLGEILKLGFVRAPLNLLYSFISYNRKVIAPPKVFEKKGACTPEYKIGYRLAYIVFAWFITSLILTRYAMMVYPFVPATNLYREFIICGGQIFFQMVFVLMISRDKLLHYIGNMMTVSLIGGLLLLPVIILNTMISVGPMVSLAWFGLVVSFMLFLHWRRMKWLGLRTLPTFTWVLYRLIVLCIILL
jgi:predicted DCC family thiol-disulfide oxidoreductase YuxK